METLSMALAEENIQKPKKLIFDKPFIILMRNIKKSNPYFVMKVDNTELMIK
jgi:serine protease inhibitor